MEIRNKEKVNLSFASSSIDLFICISVVSLCLFYNWVTLQYHIISFVAQIILGLRIGSSSCWVPMYIYYVPILLLLEYFLTLWYYKIPGAYFVYF